jgi:hypothetical protein
MLVIEGAIRTDVEAREIVIAETIAFLREANSIRMEYICDEMEDGHLIVIKRRLIATS